jgi:DNA invertase Pin-like site-specific DNA recombinase
MIGAELIPATLLERKAVVYVRQSTQSQVMTNLESQRRQYDLVDVARQRGFADIEVIDDDLGRSASGTVARPGFDRLVSWLCAGKVGAVLCFDASRLARNGRDWHHLLELCGLVEARVIDLDGVYNPCRPNDRLLLGMKGSISEFELGVLRARMLDAARSKARRGELRLSVPFGYVWHREAGLGFDPDLRLQEVIRLIFARFRELGSARQVLLSMKADQIHFPRPSDQGRMTSFVWQPIRYRNVIAVLKNPFYAGVYVYGKSEKRTSIVDGRARRSYGHGKPIGTWEVMIKDHHEGYINWEEYERNQQQLALNNYGRAGGTKSGRGGKALLSGIMTCGRCGRRLSVSYTGNPQSRPVYRCDKPNLMMGLSSSVEFSANVGIENSLAGPRARAADDFGGPSCAPVADDCFRCDSEGSGAGDPAWRTDDDLGATPPGTVDHGDRAAHRARPEDSAQVCRTRARAAGLRATAGRPAEQACSLSGLSAGAGGGLPGSECRPAHPRDPRARLQGRLHGGEALRGGHPPAEQAEAVRGSLRDPAGIPGSGRLRPLRHQLHR